MSPQHPRSDEDPVAVDKGCLGSIYPAIEAEVHKENILLDLPIRRQKRRHTAHKPRVHMGSHALGQFQFAVESRVDNRLESLTADFHFDRRNAIFRNYALDQRCPPFR